MRAGGWTAGEIRAGLVSNGWSQLKTAITTSEQEMIPGPAGEKKPGGHVFYCLSFYTITTCGGKQQTQGWHFFENRKFLCWFLGFSDWCENKVVATKTLNSYDVPNKVT